MSAPPPRSAARLPVLFVGHGSPLNAIEDNRWSRALRALAVTLPAPRAILAVSAHWYVPTTRITGDPEPETIHDFSVFPPQLYAVRYPAPGDPALARRAADLLGPDRARVTDEWGLDHGTWSVLVHLRPAADVPVVQLSVHRALPPDGHLALGRALAPLRDEGVMILASGNLVHNLRDALGRFGDPEPATPAWAEQFDAGVARAVTARDTDFLLGALESEAGRRAHPSPDHYLPLLYAVGATGAHDAVSFPVTGFDLGSLSMRAVRFG